MMESPSSFQHSGPNCRQIYEHVQGCPVCQQIFPGAIGKTYHDPNVAQFMGAGGSGDAIEISPTVAFLMVVLIVILLVYMIRNMSRN